MLIQKTCKDTENAKKKVITEIINDIITSSASSLVAWRQVEHALVIGYNHCNHTQIHSSHSGDHPVGGRREGEDLRERGGGA